jgi:tetrahedral aminopeptidase
MQKSRIEFLRAMVEAPSPSGFEQPVQSIVRKDMSAFADEVRTDVMGNVIGTINAGGSPRVMLAGHCDEIGFMVRHISDEGYIFFSPIGGIDRQVMGAQRVIIHNKRGPVRGIFGRKAVHMLTDEERKSVPEFHQMWIDIGAKSKEEALKKVDMCDPITFAAGFELLGDDYCMARALDDKMGTFVVTEALRLLAKDKPKASVHAVSTVQEEIGLRGAITSSFGVEPQVGIAVDVGHAADYPGVDKIKVGDIKLGGGPILHRGANINPVVAQLLIDTAEAEKIPYQMLAAPAGTGTDANTMQVSRAGIATGLVGVPLRYMHTPGEILSLSDLENAAKLVAAFCRRLKPKMSFIPS